MQPHRAQVSPRRRASRRTVRDGPSSSPPQAVPVPQAHETHAPLHQRLKSCAHTRLSCNQRGSRVRTSNTVSAPTHCRPTPATHRRSGDPRPSGLGNIIRMLNMSSNKISLAFVSDWGLRCASHVHLGSIHHSIAQPQLRRQTAVLAVHAPV